MLGLEQIILNPVMLAALAALAVGFVALGANPHRTINRIFFSASLHVATWLLCLEMALFAEDGLYWIRMASAVGAFIPAHLGIVKESVRKSGTFFVGRSWWIAGFGVMLAALCFTEWFIPSHSTPELRLRGWGYFAYMGGVIALYVVLCVQTILQTRATKGVQRMELQVLLLGGSAAGVTTIGLMVMNAITHEVIYIQLQPLVVLGFYAGTAWIMITSRVFDARHILYLGLQKLSLVLAISLFVWSSDELLVMLLPHPFAFVIAMGMGLWFASAVGPWFELVFDLNLRGDEVRRLAFETARLESRPDKLEAAYVRLLKGWAKSERALVLTHHNGQMRGHDMVLPANSQVLRGLRELRWATPERLVRQRSEGFERELQDFMETEQLGVMVACGGRTLNMVLALGVPASRRPFTYPEVNQLLELGSIIESAMERAHFSLKAQHAEQLATVGLLGASLAHKIRNPLVTIKTFVQLRPKHYDDPVFRDKFFRLIGEEASRIDRLTEQLLDLATPRSFLAKDVELHALLRSSLELVSAKADDRKIRVVKDFQASPDWVYTDPTAIRQVLLNLCFNAIQAVEGRPGDRWMRISTFNRTASVEIAIEDNGPGIEEEILPRLFQPFQSTKSTGFGLGLAICSDILTGLKATITVDSPVSGRGATFRINIPCQAS